jgi:putative endonuclease
MYSSRESLTFSTFNIEKIRSGMKTYYVYIITNKPNGTLYIGFTDDLNRRIREHKSGVCKGFAYKYNLAQLVYFEEYQSSSQAFIRERQMKKWKREWKINRIVEMNPDWNDLAKDWD